MAPKLDDDAAYKAYKQLVNRPLGVPAFGTDKDGAYIVSSGELFCRLDMLSEQEKYDAKLQGEPTIRLCGHDTRFSHTGNLRAHLTKGHKVKLVEIHKGASTMLEVIDAGTNYSGYMPAHSMMPYSQARQGHMAECQGAMHKDDLALRTPFHGSLGHGYRVPVDRSPIYSTLHIATLDQTIPKAVPAVFTPENARTLSDPIYGNRNVYIRGLRLDTNDEILAAYARLFGSVETLIAITEGKPIFGFVEYCDVRDSEKCIRGFYAQGYEVSFAKESFNSRLKAKGDHSSTNLYVSNLPKSMNEMELAAIFMNYNVVSSRILHDSQAAAALDLHGEDPPYTQIIIEYLSFFSFDSPDICKKIIRSYHGQPVGKEGILLQVRFADTPAQKDLKKITTERRRFRTIEYNASALGRGREMGLLQTRLG
ncbi:hypothetical protein VE03_10160 [Pseudogymnoascus sp. 23342-1-I1]|nr:hypothetical protein VE03_10160 [Pseudogymnoascus sp. 23342-1-I1]